MNNERYLFRGKRIDNGEIAEGHLIHTSYEGVEAAAILLIEHNPTTGFGVLKFHSVHPETVGMWSGITDKNGVKVFEGDRFKTPNGFIGRIEWGHKVYIDKKNKYECHGWLYVNDSNNHSETLDSEILAGEVIGSIHDNDKAVNP